MIGGNLATNAGGVNVLKYGNARDLCYGLEVVMPDGKILNDLNDLKKDNSGYDIKNLIIGSEGTLGVITAASLKTFPLTNNVVALMSVNTTHEAVKLYSFLSSKLEFSLHAFELINITGIKFLITTGLLIKTFPISTSKNWWLLVEVGGAEQGDLIESFQKLLSQASAFKMIDEIIISQNSKQYNDIWKIRELIPEANRLVGSVSNHDISLPLNRISDFIERAGIEILEVSEELRINCFGHMGDGNLHYNIFPPAGKSKDEYKFYQKEIHERVNNLVHEFKGSISAEHGIGRLKREELYKYSDPIKLDLMKSIKDLFDPNGILNPGTIFL